MPNGSTTRERNYIYKVYSNGEYKFVVHSKDGSTIDKSVSVNNIDNVSPNGSCQGYYKNGVSYVTVNASDNVKVSKFLVNGNTYTSSSIQIGSELSKIDVIIYDTANNSRKISCSLSNNNSNNNTQQPNNNTQQPNNNTKPESDKDNIPSKGSQGVANIKISSFNIGRGSKVSGVKPASFANYLTKHDIDIVGIQEALGNSKYSGQSLINNIKDAANYSNLYYTKSVNANAVLTNYKVVSKENFSLVKCGEARNLQKVVVNINSVNISFYNTHLSYQSGCPEKQIKDVKKIMDKDSNPVILTGDFNVATKCYKLTDVLANDYKLIAQSKGGHGCTDAIFLAGKGKVTFNNYSVIDTKGVVSDHYMLVANLSVTN